MKTFCFTVDDNIRFFKEIMQKGYKSIFEHPYLQVYKRLHEQFGIKVQLNLFFEDNEFDLREFASVYQNEWEENCKWLKLSFHSQYENVSPYEFSGYQEVYEDCKNVHEQILRFATPNTLAKTTTVHYCLATEEGLKALADNGVKGLLGLFGDDKIPRTSYNLDFDNASKIRAGKTVKVGDFTFGGIDIVLNLFSVEKILNQLNNLNGREHINVMIHEQYFYPDYFAYQSNFEEKLVKTFEFFNQNGYVSKFFEEVI